MKYKFLLLAFLLYLSIDCNAQLKKSIHYNKLQLSDLLTELEGLFDVKFSYNTSSFQGITMTIANDAISLPDIISIISDQYPIFFKQVDERYYVARLQKKFKVCGYVNDVHGKPIIGATIINEFKKKGSLSDDKGFFNIDTNSLTDTLKVSFLGYKTFSIPVKDVLGEKCKKYTANQESFWLNEVVINEYLASGIIKKRNGAVKIMPNDLEIISGIAEPDVLENIQLLPGIESPLETASGIYIRGGTPDQNLILWDGIKMYNSDHFFGFISTFNPYILEDITIIKNGTEAKYGDRVSGVIDIKTEEEISKKLEGGLGVNMTHGDVYLKFPLSKKTGVLVSARRSITDIVETPTISEYTNRAFQNTNISTNKDVFDPQFTSSKEEFYFTDTTLKLITSLSKKHTFSLSGLITQNKLDYSFMDIEFVDASSDKLQIRNQGANLSWKSYWNSKFTTETQVTYSKYDLDYEGVEMFLDQELKIAKENSIEEFGFLFHSDLKIGANWTLSNGYQLYSNQVDYLLTDLGGITVENKQNNASHSLYSQLQYSSPTSWLLSLGVRSSYYGGLDQSYLEPRFAVERKLGKHFRVNASFDFKNQSISQITEFTTSSFGLENQLWVMADEEDQVFPLLRSKQLTLGTLFNKNKLNIEIDTYYKMVKGLTSFNGGFETSSISNFSEGESIAQGMDILINNKIGKYSSWLGYSFSDITFDFNNGFNNDKPFVGNNNIAHSLSWSHGYQWKNFQFSLGWKYRTGIPFTQISGFEIDNGQVLFELESRNARNLPDYHRLDFSMVYNLKWSKKNDNIKSKLGFSLLNLYVQKNILQRTFNVFPSVDQDGNILVDQEGNILFELREINKRSLGLTPNITLRVSF